MAKKRSGTPRSADIVLGVPSLELVLGALDRIPGTHSAAVSYFFSVGEFERGCGVRADPRDYSDPEEFALALLSTSLLRKYPGLPGSDSKRSKAIAKWLECEDTCRVTNDRLREFRIGQVRPDLHDAFRIARSKIQKLLGDFRWSKPARYFNFGPGSTTRLPFSKRHPPYKYGLEPETTLDNLVSATAVIGLSPTWCISSGGRFIDGPVPCFRIREQSKVTTVPKDAFIDRVIAIEPDMNMYIQKGFGGFIRRRLKLVGVDLDDQSLNQSLARTGSLGSLATLDLSSASDTVAYELVRELLPPDWFEALLSCRTHSSRLPSGEIIDLQKFSSMGNGFTFELESLIFWALCSSVCSETIGREGLRAAVYGDDIIVTVGDYPKVVDILEFAGFSVNPKKSYSEGPYRESCGKHYFYGRDVTPVTITKEVTHVSQLLLLCNNLTRWSARITGGLYRHSAVREVHRYCVGHLPLRFQRPRLPDGYGDGALIGSFAEVRPVRSGRGWDGWWVPGVILPKQRRRKSSGVSTLTAVLARLESICESQQPSRRDVYKDIRGTSFRSISSLMFRGRDKVSVEDWSGWVPDGSVSEIVSVDRAKLGPVFVPLWSDIGPWGP